ncbi:MAG: 1-deoxy-D-xylulose-5-phosphate reductoisomerase [Vulcanimicrobiaceae bacterium]
MAGKLRRVAILGSTGSIGTQALEVVARHRDRFRVVALAAGIRIDQLGEQARDFDVPLVSCARFDDLPRLQSRLAPSTKLAAGADGLVAVAAQSGADIVLAATDGAVAFDAVFAAVDRGIDIAVANKELVVAAGELLFAAARRSGSRLLPVDSEHSALFQCLVGEPPQRIRQLILTASGGPFWELPPEAIARASVEQALQHPTWRMGTKNTIDSATMMNKGLEVIEASRFFDVPGDRIAVLIHRTSIAHGFVVFSDGSIKAQLAPPDMRLPIGYALAYPDRLPDNVGMDPFAALGAAADASRVRLDFERPDPARFPCLPLAFAALQRGGTAPAVLSAANEVAVDAFVAGRIGFGSIAPVIEAALAAVPAEALSLAAVRTADRLGRQSARAALGLHDRRTDPSHDSTLSKARGVTAL